MVINKTAFEAADAMQYIDQETHTWTTEGFENALRALVNAGYFPTGLIYCSGQGGDQGTRALVTNLYDGRFTNEEHTLYTMDSEANIKGLTKLQELANEGLITFDASINGGEEIALFVNGTSQMAFCWNAAQVASNKDKLADSIELFPMAFPSEDGAASGWRRLGLWPALTTATTRRSRPRKNSSASSATTRPRFATAFTTPVTSPSALP
ncbi:MAG: hypothetical protein ACLS6G_11355 [Christensenellales bacterium]